MPPSLPLRYGLPALRAPRRARGEGREDCLPKKNTGIPILGTTKVKICRMPIGIAIGE
jgi:hypothetical protein